MRKLVPALPASGEPSIEVARGALRVDLRPARRDVGRERPPLQPLPAQGAEDVSERHGSYPSPSAAFISRSHQRILWSVPGPTLAKSPVKVTC